ncbi:thiamine/thiamine pyrophosphate ABC transporter permease [Martelella soudanensis]|uniref:thiamine/thiamine pyrophosphate ABC transporter permease n=1 Tax=unclassified Martelella TaxID=2629616 RepID=UPI0015DF4967|nr:MULTISPECIES: thiamine/thiamine pyrophosphate ABC transporter permease [unclassified Martelella]
MFLSPSERRRSYGYGIVALAGVVGFIVIAIVALSGFGRLQASIAVFDEPYVWRILRFTLWQATLSTLISVALAIPVARALARRPHFPGRLWIVRLMAVPLGLPVLIGALGLIGIWGRQGIFNDLLTFAGFGRPLQIYGLQGILLAHVYFNLPLAARLFLAGLERVPQEYFKSAAMLSMPGRAVFRFIEWPVIAPLIAGVAGLIFMLCATSFTLVLILGGGPAATTIEVAIYQALRFDFNPARAVALAGMQIGLTGMVLTALAFLPKAADPGTSADTALARPDGAGRLRVAADTGLIALFTVFLALPLAIIVIKGVEADLLKLLGERIFLSATATSLAIAFGAALISLSVALAFITATGAVAAAKRPNVAERGFSATMAAMGSLVLLVPPIVLGTGWFLLLRPFGLTDAAAPLVVAGINALMALPFVLRVLAPAIAVHRARTARLSASLGLSGLARMRIVDWPGLKKPLSTALSFATALSLGDLGAVALFGGDDLTTLPWLLYSRLGSYRTDDANGLALLLGAICLVLMVAGTRQPAAR